MTLFTTGNSSADSLDWCEIPIMWGTSYTSPNTTTDTTNVLVSTNVEPGDGKQTLELLSGAQMQALKNLTFNVTATLPNIGSDDTIVPYAAGFVYGYDLEVDIYNPQSFAVEVCIFHLKCKRDWYPTATGQPFGNANHSAECMLDFISLTNQTKVLAVGGGSTIGTSAETYGQAYYSPMMSPEVGMFWDCYKEVIHIIEAGGSLKFNEAFKFPPISAQSLSGLSCKKNVSYSLLFRSHPSTISANVGAWNLWPSWGSAFHTTSKNHGLAIRYFKRWMVRPTTNPFLGSTLNQT